MRKIEGKVWLVGAGPGDAGLLTLKGKEILSQAEVVVYDRLIGDGILALIPREAEVIDVGKRAGNHTVLQEEISRILLNKALEGKRVVRLKGGDPFLFGRGGEELELLSKHGIVFEVVPGVTSAIAVPSYAGIPVTHRAYASSVHIITGHRKTGETLCLDFDALVRLSGTLVFLMGVSSIEEICNGLLDAGMKKDMPAAVVSQGTCAAQKKVIANLEHLSDEVVGRGLKAPAVLIIGDVCRFGNKFSWWEELPLSGKKILVTRPKERSGEISRRLRELGAEVLEVPSIRIEPVLHSRKMEEEMERLSEYQYIAFTSPSGVGIFFDGLKQAGKDIRSIGNARLAAIGQGTKHELEERGLVCELMPKQYDGEHLGILLGEVCKDDERILIPRAESGNQKLIEEIRKRTKAKVVDMPIYRTVYEESLRQIDVKNKIEQGEIHMVIFTSASTVKGFVNMTEGLDYHKVKAVCIGKQTETAARSFHMRTITANSATIDSLIDVCVNVS